MAKTKQQKSDAKDKLVRLFKDSQAVIFADYQGLNVAKADVLRKKMFEQNLNYVVAKKSIINLAAKEAGLELDAKALPGMIGVAFSGEDEVAPAKILGDMSKESTLKLVGGVYGKQVVDQAYVVNLSTLPSKQQLYGMFVGVINGPVSGFVRALDAIRQQKEAAETTA